VALFTWNSKHDIEVHGQQVGGPFADLAVLCKINGRGKIELDGMTPVVQMPSGN
jgi:hypothetical protein